MHKGSREALLGKDPDHELVKSFSNELQVKDDTPPAILFHADDDNGVPPENSILMYQALRNKGIPAELHIVSEGEHGFGLSTKNEHTGSWTNSLKLWLEWIGTQYPNPVAEFAIKRELRISESLCFLRYN